MRRIELDGTNWLTGSDFYNAFFDALGAPRWHGTNVNALVESMIFGGINEVEPPYVVVVKGADKIPSDLVTELNWLKEGLESARLEYHAKHGRDIEVYLHMEP